MTAGTPLSFCEALEGGRGGDFKIWGATGWPQLGAEGGGMVAGGGARGELRAAAGALRARGMHRASRWAAEQLMGLPPPAAGGGGGGSGSGFPGGLAAAGDEEACALAFFDNQEYQRAAHCLEGVAGEGEWPVAPCLRLHALYLAGEKRREEEETELAGPLGPAAVGNAEAPALERAIAVLLKGGRRPDPFLNYLRGTLLLDLGRRDEARECLLASVRVFPCNWSAWAGLLPLFERVPEEGEPANDEEGPLPEHWMADFFRAALSLELQSNERAMEYLEGLKARFPRSDHVKAQLATAKYNLRLFDEAQQMFLELREKSPHRMEGMDTYSNILYVKEDYAGLSHLAHHAMRTSKFKPETCCIVGNYYSLRMMHEKAVQYFQRALKLNKRYLSAWTLMGHEYVEMKRTEAAIEAYRRAVEINPRDYRAWYGMGQTYEVLHMPHYALHYFRQATRLRPNDARFWCAMGQCYQSEQLNLLDKAVACYQNAERQGDREGIALAKLAELHERRGNMERAYQYHLKNLERLGASGAGGGELVNTLRFLAQFCAETGSLAEAEDYCMRLLDFGGNHREEAKMLLRDIRLHLQPHAEQPGTPEQADPDDDSSGGMDMDTGMDMSPDGSELSYSG